FYEYEAKALSARHRAPLLRGRLARTAAEAKAIAAEIGDPVVLKSQVLTGGRMKAGGVKFAETPDEAESAAQAILALEIKGQKARGVLVEQRAGVVQEYFAAVTWDGRRKLPVLVFSDMGGIDIEEVAETHPEHVAQVHLSTLLPFSPFRAKEAVAAVGVLGLVIGAGGGSLTLFDAIRKHGGRPANYCEIGGNPSVRKACELTKLILSKPGVRKIAVMMNVVSNTRVDIVARGVIKGCVESG